MKTTPTDGIEIKFGKGRSLRVLSYAVIRGGCRVVSHATTRGNRIAGMDLTSLLAVERSRYPMLTVIPFGGI